jgi:branched-chain amino acid transport system substrate-binding protein
MNWTTRVFTIWILLGTAIFTSSCGKPEPIRIGFVAGLSGRVADLGVAGRNGAILAIEQKNKAGGIKGRPIELLVRDDKQHPETAKQVVSELLNQNVDAIIGPMTSSMAMVAVPLANAKNIVMVSPTVTTTNLAGMDDNFIRVISTTKDYAAKTARYQFEKLDRRTFSAIYDINNRAYTESWLSNFRKAFEAFGGSMLAATAFRSGEDAVFFEAAQKLLSVSPDFVLIITNAVDAALICQQLHKFDQKVSIVLSEWASTERLIELGGATTEGAYIAQFLDRNDTSQQYLKFRQAYQERFGQEPGFAGMAGYDAGIVVLKALTDQKPGESLKGAILNKKIFQCVQQSITIDRYGDADRNTFVTVIRNGKYITIE